VPSREAIGKELGLSKERVRQLEVRALKRLRGMLNTALDATPFMVAAVPNREEVVLPLSRNDALRFLHLDVSETPARTLHDIEVPDVLTFPEAVTVSPDGRYAFVGAEVSKELLIIDLVDGSVQRRPWLAELGPTALAVVP
ncbi:MAG: sigma factor-like helix-turn-helix DNA-binding protein, partial [Vicinamibacterales bacterium]|nr:sigma factor-like helix-turn-helix DNA-binding protein [Vicinamibacterales bacterium]